MNYSGYMANLVSKSECENIVLDYLVKNTQLDPSKFNPTKLTVKEISKKTKLDEEHIEEALQKLSEESPRVEKIKADFEFWLPLSEYAEKIKKDVYKSNLAYYNLFLFSFISVIILLYVLKWMVNNGSLNLQTGTDYFFAGAIVTAISIKIAKLVTNRFFSITEKIKKVKGYKVYVWIFVILTGIIVYVFNNGLENYPSFKNTILWISIISNIITIIVFLVSLFHKK